ncbi:STAS domain-containing protein [Azospirillum picis]|uniref:Anti-anti-sigma regulatory factor n=1 Tax=Azospirillum picis TaxID=488438 RepID=A0ABU0MWE9_9PROT|nr:STAS domain-containing protein [Azospirillum picis]MBP2303503.1 anti-anti-sigma regulatory factor [Azospirillum picis]MDQ0537406.1 anti-anti-sigma regulatory factor [Azospirillum picis]
MLEVSHYTDCTSTLVERLTQAVREVRPDNRLSISLDGIDFLSLPELTALLSAMQSARRRGITTDIVGLSSSLESLLTLAGVTFH